MNLSRNQTRKLAGFSKKEHNISVLSSEAKLNIEKSKIIPKFIFQNNNQMRINVKSLLEFIVNSLVCNSALFSKTKMKQTSGEFIFKFGFDGTNTGSNFKISSEVDDSFMFISMLSPLVLKIGDKIWKNPTPSSALTCFPICISVIINFASFSIEKNPKKFTKKNIQL